MVRSDYFESQQETFTQELLSLRWARGNHGDVTLSGERMRAKFVNPARSGQAQEEILET